MANTVTITLAHGSGKTVEISVAQAIQIARITARHLNRELGIDLTKDPGYTGAENTTSS
jgi:hypothetical protein